LASLSTQSQTRKQMPKQSKFEPGGIDDSYFRVRDFELVQPLYDLAFLLEVNALATGGDVPKYRTFSLWRAGLSLDGYGTIVGRWLKGDVRSEELDHVPSPRIRQHLSSIQQTGTLPELDSYKDEKFRRALRLRSVRGLGPSSIAQTLSREVLDYAWLQDTGLSNPSDQLRIANLYQGPNYGPWQSAHIVPPILRFLKTLEALATESFKWAIVGIDDPFEPVKAPVSVSSNTAWDSMLGLIKQALTTEVQFRAIRFVDDAELQIEHQMGWVISFRPHQTKTTRKTISELARAYDPLSSALSGDLLSDLHLHTAWSDGSASVNTMAGAVIASGLNYFAVTDHSRSSKLQGGLTPILWLRQASALSLAHPVCPVLHGIEVDILKNGELDLPYSLLAASDIVVASVHSNWALDIRENTDRLLRAVESGHIDVIAHPTSAIIGKPGVPDYVRAPAEVHWREVFDKCAQWGVAVEFNCFPSRLDLPITLLSEAVMAGCALSIGSDAHARSHLINLRFGQAMLGRVDAPVVLNRMPYAGLRQFIANAREHRKLLAKTYSAEPQHRLPFEISMPSISPLLRCRIQPPQDIPDGSPVVGIDLTAGDKATGVAYLSRYAVETCSLVSDEEILDYVRDHRPSIVSIDSPLGLPGGGKTINPSAGIVRVAERDLASIGIPAYPALIDSMKKLTLRGIRLAEAIKQFDDPPTVIESYPGAAQDILCIPRKQKSLSLLREGLRRLGLHGPGLETLSHDEMDAITSAIVGRYFEAGLYEAMGIASEAQLIVPKIRPILYEESPLICLAGRTGAGKSVVARYLSVFFGFKCIRTRDLIKRLMIADLGLPLEARLSDRPFDAHTISEEDLLYFGARILNVHKQTPLRRELTASVEESQLPIVVDSIRDIVDIEQRLRRSRQVIIWFVDCNESIIEQRLATRSKLGVKRVRATSAIDSKALVLREEANTVIQNNGTLEDLRWAVDDALFSMLSIGPQTYI
jgi:histidinol phosphatase-like PHP family hydrolase/predicted nuclease with RNAse H fold/dephospho-CoA kinase